MNLVIDILEILAWGNAIIEITKLLSRFFVSYKTVYIILLSYRKKISLDKSYTSNQSNRVRTAFREKNSLTIIEFSRFFPDKILDKVPFFPDFSRISYIFSLTPDKKKQC